MFLISLERTWSLSLFKSEDDTSLYRNICGMQQFPFNPTTKTVSKCPQQGSNSTSNSWKLRVNPVHHNQAG